MKVTKTLKIEFGIITWLVVILLFYYLFLIFPGGYDGEKHYIYPFAPTKYTTYKNYVYFITLHLVFIIKVGLIYNLTTRQSRLNRLSLVSLFLFFSHFLVAYLMFGKILCWDVFAFIDKPLMKESFYLFPFYNYQWPLGWYLVFLMLHIIDLMLTVGLYWVVKKQISKPAAMIVMAFIVLVLLKLLDFILYNGQTGMPYKVGGITIWIIYVIFNYMDREEIVNSD
ncbi:hypothetical protein [Flexithrix dorotheae]|uniref:hypothetical protein n=1 Tax=Flexithrix dorotheae TaxID=70993 RepID=UPI000365545C|nr:hypothetical protein [Flexithrix dorotheae]